MVLSPGKESASSGGEELRDLNVGQRDNGLFSAPVNDRYQDPAGSRRGLNRLDVADRLRYRVFGIIVELIANGDLSPQCLSKIRFRSGTFSNDRYYSSPPRSSAGA